jgi:antitoxin PrlF
LAACPAKVPAPGALRNDGSARETIDFQAFSRYAREFRGGSTTHLKIVGMIYSLHQSKEIIMASATLTSKGQVTLPKSVRERLGIEAGDRLEFIESEQGFLVVAATRDIRTLKGIIGRPKQPVTIEDMNGAIEKMGRMP